MNPIDPSPEQMKLLAKILKARDAALRNGMRPTEVWLGPAECSVLGNPASATISSLTVRRSAEPGVFVGITYGFKG
jgi:hypothetical protein